MPALAYSTARAAASAASVICARSASVMIGAGRLLDDLLVAALDRALALAEVHERAVPVAEYLHLDVARAAR